MKDEDSHVDESGLLPGIDPEQFNKGEVPSDDPELMEYRRKVQELKQRSEKLFADFGMSLAPADIEMARAQLLLEHLLPAGSRARLKFELEFTTLALGQIETHLNRLNAMRAQQGLAVPKKGLFLPGNGRMDPPV